MVIPDVLAGVHPKSAITKRNRWMAENSDFVVTYVYRDFGGAYDAKKYALKLGKTVFETTGLMTKNWKKSGLGKQSTVPVSIWLSVVIPNTVRWMLTCM